MNRKKTALCLLLAGICLAVSTNLVPAKALTGSARATKVKVYLVALDDKGKHGKKIGCDDSLVVVNRTVQPTKAPLKAALDMLLSMPQEYTQGGLQLGNYWKGDNLKVKSVSITRGTATIRITGSVFVAGVCDEPRIIEQIEATAKQFATVKRVRVYVNDTPLKEAIR